MKNRKMKARTGKASSRSIMPGIRRAFLLVAFAVIVLAIYVFAFHRGGNLTVEGVPFRVWVANHPDMGVEECFVTIGTNAIPEFVHILNEPEESARVFAAKSWVWRHLPQSLQSRFVDWYPSPRWQLKRTALFGLRYFGEEAEPTLPTIIRIAQSETNLMVRASALVAALQIAPESPHVFALWRDEWEHTNHFSRRDLAIYIQLTQRPIPAAVPLLMDELRAHPDSVNVIEAFGNQGEFAYPAVPYIAKMLESEHFRENMIHLVQALGPVAADAAPQLAGLLKENDPRLLGDVLFGLKAIGPDANVALPAVKTLLSHKDAGVRMIAAVTAAHIEGKPEQAVPLLWGVLAEGGKASTKCSMRYRFRQNLPAAVTSSYREIAVMLLGECGKSASPATFVLDTYLKDDRVWIRLAAAESIWRIDGDAEHALPPLIQTLDAQPAPKQAGTADSHLLVRTIEIMVQMGPAATNAVPALERVRTFSPVSHRAVIAALQQINSHQQ